MYAYYILWLLSKIAVISIENPLISVPKIGTFRAGARIGWQIDTGAQKKPPQAFLNGLLFPHSDYYRLPLDYLLLYYYQYIIYKVV